MFFFPVLVAVWGGHIGVTSGGFVGAIWVCPMNQNFSILLHGRLGMWFPFCTAKPLYYCFGITTPLCIHPHFVYPFFCSANLCGCLINIKLCKSNIILTYYQLIVIVIVCYLFISLLFIHIMY